MKNITFGISMWWLEAIQMLQNVFHQRNKGSLKIVVLFCVAAQIKTHIKYKMMSFLFEYALLLFISFVHIANALRDCLHSDIAHTIHIFDAGMSASKLLPNMFSASTR